MNQNKSVPFSTKFHRKTLNEEISQRDSINVFYIWLSKNGTEKKGKSFRKMQSTSRVADKNVKIKLPDGQKLHVLYVCIIRHKKIAQGKVQGYEFCFVFNKTTYVD